MMLSSLGIGDVSDALTSTETIRTLFVAAFLGLFTILRRLLKDAKANRMADAKWRRGVDEKMDTFSNGVQFIGTEVQGLKASTEQKFDEQADYRAEVRNKLVELASRMDVVNYELHPNGGGSMKDAVNRTEAKVNNLASQFDDHLEAAAYQLTRLDRLADRPIQSVQVNTPPPRRPRPR